MKTTYIIACIIALILMSACIVLNTNGPRQYTGNETAKVTCIYSNTIRCILDGRYVRYDPSFMPVVHSNITMTSTFLIGGENATKIEFLPQ